MFRKTIIFTLILGTIACGILWALSYWQPFVWRTRNLDDMQPVTTAAEARIPLAFEVELRDGRVFAGHLYTLCGNPRDRSFKFAGVEFTNTVERLDQGHIVEKAAFVECRAV